MMIIDAHRSSTHLGLSTTAPGPDDTTSPRSATEEITSAPDFGRILLSSIIWTTAAMVLGVGLPMWALTGQIWDGIGLGLFCAFWGGPGFGTMLAGALWSNRVEVHKSLVEGVNKH